MAAHAEEPAHTPPAQPPQVESTPVPASVGPEDAPFLRAPLVSSPFRNPWPHPALPGLGGVLRWKLSPNPLKPPGYKPEPLTLPEHAYAQFMAGPPAPTRVFWIGHASFLVELDGVRVVIDPIFGRAGGFVPRVTPAAVSPDELTDVAAVVVTHGHHDHLDPAALRQIARRNRGRTLFIVPSGLGRSLPRDCEPRVELSWWQNVAIAGIRVHLLPAQHWHQRGPFDRNRALWASVVLEGTHRVYHSGDTGYFGGFRTIGKVFDGIDLSCLPLGAYEPRWFMGSQHMSPEQSLQAFSDLSATHFVGMHWGTFDLSDEPVRAGPRLLFELSEQRALNPERLHVVRPGGSVALEGPRGATRARTTARYAP